MAVRGGAGGETDRLVSVGVEHEESLGDVGRARGFVLTVAAHATLAIAAYAMRIDGQNPALKIARSAAHLAQGQLEAFAVDHGSSTEKFVDGHIGGKERQAVGQLEDVLVQAAAEAQAGDTEGRLVDELESQPRFDSFGFFPSPAADQVPGPQPEQFWGEQPQPGQVTHDLVGKELSNSMFDAEWVAGDGFGAGLGGLRFQRGLRVGAVAIEFFFEGHTFR